LTCTGSESVDLALRIARNVTGGTGFIATENAYHGNTTTATEISAASASGEARPRSIYLVPAPDTYRHPKDAGRRFVRAVETAIEEMHAAGIRLAGFIADSAFSSDGVYVDEPGFLAEVAEVVRKNHGLYIADEVQPGFSRLGDSMWGFERHGVIPDLVVMGKQSLISWKRSDRSAATSIPSAAARSPQPPAWRCCRFSRKKVCRKMPRKPASIS